MSIQHRRGSKGDVSVVGWLVFGLVLVCSNVAFAEQLFYTDRAAFDARLTLFGVTPQTLNFESIPSGTVINDGDTLGGVTFHNFNLYSGSTQLTVASTYSTTSGTNYLGDSDAGNGYQIVGGSQFDLGLNPAHALGMYITTTADALDGDIRLQVGSGYVDLNVSAIDPLSPLPDGSKVLFLGIIDDTNAFTSAGIRAGPTAAGAMFYNIDDIVFTSVPEPGTIAAFLSMSVVGMAAFYWHRRRKRRAAVAQATEDNPDGSDYTSCN